MSGEHRVDPKTLVSALASRVPSFKGKRVLVAGDPVLDVYLLGTTHRISREAPVLIVREDGRELRLGGAANAAANLSALGASVDLVGLAGDDQAGADLIAHAASLGIGTAGMLREKARKTVTKTRVLAGGLHTRKQQMLRIDVENDGPPTEAERARFLDAALTAAERADAIVISDYSDGSLRPVYSAIAERAAALGKVVVVDSRTALTSFRNASCVTPNEPEVEAALGITLGSATAALDAAERLLRELSLEAAVVTRGREGMAVASRSGTRALIKAHGAPEAVDVTGAGDTVTATVTLALAAGAPILEGAILANCAASLVVQRVGAATVTPEELLASLAEIDAAGIEIQAVRS